MKSLTIDIGNSKAKLAVFEGEEILYKKSLSSGLTKEISDLLSKYNINKSIISSVKTLRAELIGLLESKSSLYILNSSMTLPITIDYQEKEKLGSDRIAGVVAAKSLFPNHPVLVIDSGSCITYDLADASGVFRGGQISPGLRMRLQAMHHFTDALPLVQIESPASELGRSTAEALQSGAYWGIVHEMNGFIRQYAEKFENLKVLVTGGNSGLFVPKLKYEIFADPNLILVGLNKILQHHAEKDN